MKRFSGFISLLVLLSASAHAQDYGQAATLKIWDNASAPHSNGITTPETEPEPDRIGNTSEAVLYLFPADPAKATGQGLVICPGGGYERLCMDYEGHDMARWLAGQGITAAVLKYRMPNGHPEVPLEDAVRAVEILRGKVPSAEGFACARVGIAGFSAGGHLAAMTAAMGEPKPDFAILFYPVITARTGILHEGSFRNLLGSGRDAETDARYSLENRVTAATPPTLLLLSDDDRGVPPMNGTLFYNALKACGVPASMHIYPSGGHGWGMREEFRYRDAWQQAVLDWLQRVNEPTE